MSSNKFILVSFLILALFGAHCLALRCGKSSIFDNEEFFSCPRPYDSPEDIFCCPGNTCCSDPWKDQTISWLGNNNNNVDDAEPLPKPEARSIIKSIGKLIGIVVGAVIFILVVCVVCCCCCPFCLLAKKRSGGVVLSDNNQQQGQNQSYPPLNTGYPTQDSDQVNPNAAYPPQNQGYPIQNAAYPPQNPGYPTQNTGYPPQNPGYPPQDPGYPQQSGYPMQPTGGQPGWSNPSANPPPYTNEPQQGYQNQPAYNPNY